MGLEKALEDYEKRLNEQRKEKEDEKRKEEEYWNNEKRIYDKKLIMAKEVYAWAKTFTKTREYKGALSILKEVIIYSGGWGHKHKDSYGCWSRIYLNKNGTLKYKSGYKWMGIRTTLELKKPRNLAGKIKQEYIKGLHESIMTGEVIKNLEKKIKGVI